MELVALNEPARSWHVLNDRGRKVGAIRTTTAGVCVHPFFDRSGFTVAYLADLEAAVAWLELCETTFAALPESCQVPVESAV